MKPHGFRVRNAPWQSDTLPEGLPLAAGTCSVCAGAGPQRSSGARELCVSQMLFQPTESGGKNLSVKSW